jgi:hypothetical protein
MKPAPLVGRARITAGAPAAARAAARRFYRRAGGRNDSVGASK